VEGPEYETIALFGGNCVLKTIEEVAYANYLCDELGIDTISAGVVIGWVIECFQTGILTHDDIGRAIDFSDLDSVVYLLNKISGRIWQLTRAFSVREINGFGRHLDFPPARLTEEPIADGPNQGHVLSKEDIHNLLTWYYTARGWNENGIPTRETLISAGLAEVVEAFEKRGLLKADG